MKARVKLTASFAWEFAEVEYTAEVEARIAAVVARVRDAIRREIGTESGSDVRTDVTVLHAPLMDINSLGEKR